MSARLVLRPARSEDPSGHPSERLGTAPGSLSGVGFHWGIFRARGYREPSSRGEFSRQESHGHSATAVTSRSSVCVESEHWLGITAIAGTSPPPFVSTLDRNRTLW